MKKYLIPKLIGLALLTMVCLVLLSFIEVAIYSYLINPGHPEAYYEKHAEITAPYISGLFGFLIFFMVSRYWTKKPLSHAFQLSLYFPITYFAIDFIIITLAVGIGMPGFALIFLVANSAKFLGSILGHWLTQKSLSKTA